MCNNEVPDKAIPFRTTTQSSTSDGIICTGIRIPSADEICIMVLHSKDPGTVACVDSQGGEHKAVKGVQPRNVSLLRDCVDSTGNKHKAEEGQQWRCYRGYSCRR